MPTLFSYASAMGSSPSVPARTGITACTTEPPLEDSTGIFPPNSASLSLIPPRPMPGAAPPRNLARTSCAIPFPASATVRVTCPSWQTIRTWTNPASAWRETMVRDSEIPGLEIPAKRESERFRPLSASAQWVRRRSAIPSPRSSAAIVTEMQDLTWLRLPYSSTTSGQKECVRRPTKPIFSCGQYAVSPIQAMVNQAMVNQAMFNQAMFQRTAKDSSVVNRHSGGPAARRSWPRTSPPPKSAPTWWKWLSGVKLQADLPLVSRWVLVRPTFLRNHAAPESGHLPSM